MKEVKRVLKPEGIIYINDFLLNDDERNKNRYAEYYEKYNIYGVFELADGAVSRHHNEERVKEWTSDFQQLEYEKVEYVRMNGNRSNGMVYMGSLK